MADQPAPTAPGTVYHVGSMPDGRAILSAAGGLPVDDTEVWFADRPDARMTVVELEDANPVPDGETIAWASQPEPYDPPAAKAPETPPAPAAPAPRQAAVTIDGEPPTGAMIALAPEAPEAFADPDGDPAEALHVTLKWLGKADGWEADERQAVEDIVEAWANRHSAAITGKVAGAGRLGDQGAAVLFLEADELPSSRLRLDADLTAAFGPDVEDTHPSFIPHLTTGYGVEPRYDLMGEPVSFREVRVHWGPETRSFPLDNEVAYIAAVEPGDTPDDDEQVDELPEVEVDRLSDLVDDAEQQVGELEGLVAELVMAQVKDELFDDDPLPRTASLTEDDVVGYRSRLAAVKPKMAHLAALSDDLPDDLAERVEALMARLDALGESVGQMMLSDVDDLEMPTLPEGSGTFVDETNPNRPGHDDEEDEDDEPDEDDGETPDEDQDEDPEGDEEDDPDGEPEPDDDEEDDDGPPWKKKGRGARKGK